VAWVSESLGHSNWAVTARHYARWVDDAMGRQFTPELDSGDVWPDLLARVGATIDPESPPNFRVVGTERGSRRKWPAQTAPTSGVKKEADFLQDCQRKVEMSGPFYGLRVALNLLMVRTNISKQTIPATGARPASAV
jgi:hypothetical protein